jgi:hypothetical protein
MMGKQRNRGNPPPDEPDGGSRLRKLTSGPDDSRKGPLRGSTPPESESSSRRPASSQLARLNVADILGNVGRRWEIEANTHLPLHLERCLECNRFVQHIADCSKGGLDQLIKVQRDHWIKELEDEFQRVYDDGYDKAMEESRAREDGLRETIKDLRRTILNQEQGTTHSTKIESQPTNTEGQVKKGENPLQGIKPKALHAFTKEREAPGRKETTSRRELDQRAI